MRKYLFYYLLLITYQHICRAASLGKQPGSHEYSSHHLGFPEISFLYPGVFCLDPIVWVPSHQLSSTVRVNSVFSLWVYAMGRTKATWSTYMELKGLFF